MSKEALYQVALTHVPGIGPVQARLLVDKLGSAEAIFNTSGKQLSAVEGIGPAKAAAIVKFKDFEAAEKELNFTSTHGIQSLFINHPDYPQRLLNCYDAPTLLYYRGTAPLNAPKVISIIGTRSHSEYGKILTHQLIAALKSYEAVIISGLAFGIDALAHRESLAQSLPTVGVLAHGFSTIYPGAHKSLAREMIASGGGLLTEFSHTAKPDKHNFPRRNRIVAGISDATVVIETARRGGSMITAEMACNYNREVFACPGRTTDLKSSGCNHLIRVNKAICMTHPDQLPEVLGWMDAPPKKPRQTALFLNLNPEEQIVYDLLKNRDSVHIDELHLNTGMNSSNIAAALLTLELQDIIISMPGKCYRIA